MTKQETIKFFDLPYIITIKRANNICAAWRIKPFPKKKMWSWKGKGDFYCKYGSFYVGNNSSGKGVETLELGYHILEQLGIEIEWWWSRHQQVKKVRKFLKQKLEEE